MEEMKCYFCGASQPLERHHIYFGRNRQTSERIGAVVWLCIAHHRGFDSVHHDREKDLELKRWWQEEYEKTHSRDEFMREIGRNYI